MIRELEAGKVKKPWAQYLEGLHETSSSYLHTMVST